MAGVGRHVCDSEVRQTVALQYIEQITVDVPLCSTTGA